MPATVKCSSSVWDSCVTANTNTRSKNSSTKVALLCSWPSRLRSICGAACLPAMALPLRWRQLLLKSYRGLSPVSSQHQATCGAADRSRRRVADHSIRPSLSSDLRFLEVPFLQMIHLASHAGHAIGADIYCDTQAIIRELETRFPAPTLFPGGNAGVPWALGMWTDRAFFQNTVSLVFGTLDDRVPRDFIEDRGGCAARSSTSRQ